MMKLVNTLALGAALLTLTACNNDGIDKHIDKQAAEDLEQAQLLAQQICKIDENFNVFGCKFGQRLSFQPERFGNEQLPIVVMTHFCDITKPVYFNKAGVVCIYRTANNARPE
ncbi:hypothetical protein [Alishewanella aestuarii]|nr:hypothetical protein [Alishewanella aestuarii]